MGFEHREPYITDIAHYAGPLDRISPYHYYQFVYGSSAESVGAESM